MSSRVGPRPREEFVPLSAPAIQGREWEYVKECLDTAWVSSTGQFVERFEEMVSERTGARYAVATVNGTAALHVALLIAGVQPDDEVLVSTLSFIEDATESLGARYRGTPVGILGDVACLSFNGNKTITTGGGGMILTNNGAWAARAKYLTTQAKDDPIEYIHGEIGYNYRLTNLQAAL